MKRSGLVTFLILAAAVVLALSPPALAEKVLNIGVNSGDVGIMEPHLSATTANLPVMDSIFNGLVRFRPGSVDLELIEPDLAERWESSPDGKIWTFYLRKGVQFHQGFGELTSEDVVFSLKKASVKETSRWHTSYQPIDKIEAPDKYTVKIFLKHNIPSALSLVLNYHGGMVLSKKACEKLGDKFQLNPVGTGPFAFAEYAPKQKVVLKAHDQFFRGRPKLDKVVYHFVPVDQSRELAFLKGELDLIDATKFDWWVDKMRATKGVLVDTLPPGECTVVYFNMTKKPLDNLKVRQALAYALDRKEFRQTLGMSITGEAVSPVPPGYLGYTPEVEHYDFDLAKAKALLKEAGFEKGFNLGKMATSTIYLNSAELLQSQLKKIGVAFEIQMVDHPTMHKMIRQDYNALVPYGAARFPIADEYLSQFYHSKSSIGLPTAITNFSHYGQVIPGVDDLIEAARVEPDIKKQIALWQKAQKKIMEDVPAYPLRVSYLVFARKDNVVLGYDLKSNIALHYQVTEQTDKK